MEKWFLAKIIWQIKIANNEQSAEFDEQLRLVKAENRNNALNKSIEIGHNHEEIFINSKGQQVQWQYVNVEFLKEISSFEDGMEICIQTVKVADAIEYIQEINTRSLVNDDALFLKIN